MRLDSAPRNELARSTPRLWGWAARWFDGYICSQFRQSIEEGRQSYSVWGYWAFEREGIESCSKDDIKVETGVPLILQW